MIGPRLAPLLQQRRAVPPAHLLAEALQPYLAHRQHDMRVWLGLPVLSQVPMHVHVRDHAALDKLLFEKIAGEPDALFLFQLTRQRELDFPGKLPVLAFPAPPATAPGGSTRAPSGRSPPALPRASTA